MALPFDEAGQGPAVVLLHAGIADRSMWAEHLDPLAAAGYRALAVDLPGFGEATVEEGEQAPWTNVLATMDELRIESAALVGNSFGGAVALRAAVLAPGRVSKLALISAPAPNLEPSPQLQAAWEAEEAALERGDTEAAVRAVVDAWTLPGAPAKLRERVAAMQRRAFELQANAGEATEAPDPVEADPDVLRTLNVPALVAVGEYDMPDFLQGAKSLVAALPNAWKGEVAVIRGAGHLAPLEAPEQFREVLLDFRE